MLRRRRYEKRTEHIFCTRSQKWSENRSSRFERKILLISFSRGSGPPSLKGWTLKGWQDTPEKLVQLDRKKPPWGGFLCVVNRFTMFPHQEPCARRTWYKFFEEGPLTHGSWWGTIVNRKPPPGGGFFPSKCGTTHFKQADFCLVEMKKSTMLRNERYPLSVFNKNSTLKAVPHDLVRRIRFSLDFWE